MNSVIKKAIDIAGSQKELARKVGVDQSAVSKWLRGGGIKSQYIPGIISATNGEITVSELIDSVSMDSNAEPRSA